MKTGLATYSKIFTALSSGSRLEILRYIYEKQRRCDGGPIRCRDGACIKDLAGSLNVSIPTVSHHIKELVNAELVTTQRKGKWVYCAINGKVFGEISRFLSRWSTKRT